VVIDRYDVAGTGKNPVYPNNGSDNRTIVSLRFQGYGNEEIMNSGPDLIGVD